MQQGDASMIDTKARRTRPVIEVLLPSGKDKASILEKSTRRSFDTHAAKKGLLDLKDCLKLFWGCHVFSLSLILSQEESHLFLWKIIRARQGVISILI